MIASIIHDFKHPGYNNMYLINTKHSIATRYNGINYIINISDQSVLENYHVSEAFEIINSNPKYDIFNGLSKEEYKIIRKRIIECVIATDMVMHSKEYSYMKLKLETFNINEGKNIDMILNGLDRINTFNTQQEFLNLFIHTADISNPTKPLEIYKIWVGKVMEEFWRQGDEEKKLGLPISFLCDRTTTKIPAAQLGFIEGIVLPIAIIVVEFFPDLNFMIDNIQKNKSFYKELKDKDKKE